MIELLKVLLEESRLWREELACHRHVFMRKLDQNDLDLAQHDRNNDQNDRERDQVDRQIALNERGLAMSERQLAVQERDNDSESWKS